MKKQCETQEKTIGLICGSGLLPLEFAKNIKSYGFTKLVTAAVKGYGSKEIKQLSDEYKELAITQMGALVKYFKQHNVSEAVMLGRVEPNLAIADLRLDWRLLKLAMKVKDRRADAILGTVADELMQNDGIHILDTTLYLQHLLTPYGVLTKKKPDKQQWEDIKFGTKIALASGGLDIGQTAVVYKHAVIAVEAMEGTDKCILRAGTLAKNCVIVKMAKPDQDFRFDVPCFGYKTIESMITAGAKVLAIEAGKSYLLDREETIKKANENGIIIVGIKKDSINAD